MVLGLIDFLLGGKRNKKLSKAGQVATMSSNSNFSNPAQNVSTPGVANNSPVQNQQEPIVNNVDSNNSQQQNDRLNVNDEDNKLNFKDMNNNQNNDINQNIQSNSMNQQSQGNRKSISEVIHKMNDNIKGTNEKITDLVTELKQVKGKFDEVVERVESLEDFKRDTDEKLQKLNNNMTKFLSLYELINNQYNPFVDKEESMPKKIEIDTNGAPINNNGENNENNNPNLDNFNPSEFDVFKDGNAVKDQNLNSALLELDTVNIEEAANDAVPLTRIENSTNSLVTILSWLEYLTKRVGVDETRETLRYYTETLKWITPEVFFELDKYLKGMKDKEDLEDNAKLTVRDHIVSLYFISKLNKKSLDPKLVDAVLRIIKEE